MNILTPEQIASILEEAKPQIVDTLKANIVNSVNYELRQTAAEQVSAHVKQWVTENVLPEVTRQLIDSKDSLVAVAPAFAKSLTDQLTESLNKALGERLKQDYYRRQIFKAMFE